jgi:hypothetical protein
MSGVVPSQIVEAINTLFGSMPTDLDSGTIAHRQQLLCVPAMRSR